jgi:hypothetical protein
MARASTEEPADTGQQDWSGQFARLVGVVHSFPYAVILTAGIFAVLAAFVRKIGGWELVTKGSQFLVLGVGAVLMLIGLVGPLVESRRMSQSLSNHRLDGKPLPVEAMDVEFLFQRKAVDIVYSREFDRFQRSGLTREVSDDLRHQAIHADHDRGDELALKNGYSLTPTVADSLPAQRAAHPRR